MQAWQTGSGACGSLEAINRAAEEDPRRFVLRAEQAFRDAVEELARRIAGQEPPCRLVMLAGPTSSGKTTTARLLTGALNRLGVGSVGVSLDDFFLGGDIAPLLPDGGRDYESLEAIDVADIRRCLAGLVEDGRCSMPVYDFRRHTPFPYRREVRLRGRDVAVVEGIHALDPALTEGLPELDAHRVYISVTQGVSAGAERLFGPDDVRLVRRLVRDRNFRGTPPEKTLRMWDNVMAGERRYIQPFLRDADSAVDSFHAYELCVLREQALPLLHTVPAESPRRAYADRLAEGLGRVRPVDAGLVPRDSVIREFIGGV